MAATKGILPGITFYLEVPPHIATERLKNSGKDADRLEGQGIDFYRRVFDGYKEISTKNNARVYKIDGLKSIKDVHNEIRNVVFANNGSIK
jgi:dTMP kinase